MGVQSWMMLTLNTDRNIRSRPPTGPDAKDRPIQHDMILSPHDPQARIGLDHATHKVPDRPTTGEYSQLTKRTTMTSHRSWLKRNPSSRGMWRSVLRDSAVSTATNQTARSRTGSHCFACVRTVLTSQVAAWLGVAESCCVRDCGCAIAEDSVRVRAFVTIAW